MIGLYEEEMNGERKYDSIVLSSYIVDSIMKNRFLVILSVIMAVLFGFSFMLTPVLKKGSEASVEIGHFFCGFFLYIAILAVLIKLSGCKVKERSTGVSSGWVFALAFVCISAVGIAYLVIYYPGTGMYDTLAILKSEGFGLAKQHPWFYLLLVQSLVKIVLSCGGV